MAVEAKKKATIERKVSTDKFYLQLQNLLYERNHLQCVPPLRLTGCVHFLLQHVVRCSTASGIRPII